MSFEEKLQLLRQKISEINILNGVEGLLNWDQLVFMPPAAAEERGKMMEMLGGLSYDRSTSAELGQLISDLAAEVPDLNADNDIAREIKVAKRSYDLLTCIPREKMMEIIMATSLAQNVWSKAKEGNDFASFQPHLQRIVELYQSIAEYFKPFDHPYDALLDQYEPGMKTSEVKAIFEALRPRQVELIKAISKAEQIDDSFRYQKYDLNMQKKINQVVATLQGYDWDRGRLDVTAHPFTTNFGFDDVRITTHYHENEGFSALFSTMHESGHALYELGIDRKYYGTSLGKTVSMSIHESQSRLWENLVGRSKGFWRYFYPTYQAFFPENLANVTLDQFYRGINKVSPTLIRTESDEATYNLHIMLRLELEIELISGSLLSKDLPEAWNEKMRAYLGVSPQDDTHGVLQDVHWSAGLFGYFPTYALGNLISAQWWQKMLIDQPNIPDEIAMGKLDTILNWLRENVHCYGARYDTQDLVRKVTGEGINPDPYMDYLTRKYTEIYQL